MSANSSISHLLPSSFTFFDVLCSCFSSTTGSFSVTTFTIINTILMLPLCIFILYLGHQRWRKQRSGTVMSHSDVFTYHMVVIELMYILGCILTCFGTLVNLPKMMITGLWLFFLNICGQTYFHMLTCLECYLAVAHPVSYRGLKKASWIRMRNIIIGSVWLLCFLTTVIMGILTDTIFIILALLIAILALVTVCFCSISVLCVLIRPGPGEGGGSKQQVDQSKLRAFYTIMAILGVLLLRFGQNIVSGILYSTKQLGETRGCGIWLSVPWFCLPSSLVLPLLFLHRAGKLHCHKSNSG